MDKTATLTVLAMDEINFAGNIIPETWYQHIRKTVQIKRDGTLGTRAYPEAILILADICYWYRPEYVRDERSNRIVALKRRFSEDKLHRSYQELADKFGLGKDQARNAVTWLADNGLITTEFRTLHRQGLVIANVLYIEPVASEIARISRPIIESAQEKSVPAETDASDNRDVSVEQPIPLGRATDTNSETIAETTPIEPRVPKSNKPVKRKRPVMSTPPPAAPAHPGNGADRGTGLADKPIPVTSPAWPVSEAGNKPHAADSYRLPLAPFGMRPPESDPQARLLQEQRARQRVVADDG